jgi:hypothetical protein
MNSHQWGGVLLCIGGVYLTLLGYDLIPERGNAGGDRLKNKLRWLGPFTFLLGLADILLKGSL